MPSMSHLRLPFSVAMERLALDLETLDLCSLSLVNLLASRGLPCLPPPAP